MSSCTVCKSLAIRKNGTSYDDRYGYPGTFNVLRCCDCGHIFLEGEFPAELLQNLYSNYYPRSTFNLKNYQPYKERNGFFAWLDGIKGVPFRWVPENVTILDIGCGFGESLGYHESRGCTVFGVEVDENIRRVADKYGYKVHVGLFDPTIYEPESFDYVTMSQVIEHVTNPTETLQGIAKILKSGGQAILSTPNPKGLGAKLFGRRWVNWHSPYHLQFFTPKSMQLTAKNAGLVIDRTMTITPSAWIQYQWIHLFTFPKEAKPSVFWVPGAPLTRSHALVIRIASLLHKLKIDHIWARLVDMLQLGDNRLYFIRKP